MYTFKLLDERSLDAIITLIMQLNPDIAKHTLIARYSEMFSYNSYYCFGAFCNDALIGVSSGWLTTRIYSGKQLEIDNVVVDANVQSKGIGSLFLNYIQKWAMDNSCLTVELNTYVANERSHKFYFNKGYKILGFHFQKNLID